MASEKIGSAAEAAVDPIPDYHLRLTRVREQLRRRKIDLLLVSQPENRRYLSGFTAHDHSIGESSGALLVYARAEARLLTDFRYKIQAERETSLEVSLYPKGLLDRLDEEFCTHKIKRFAFESRYTLHAFSVKLAERAQKHGVTLVPLDDLIERLRICKSEDEIELIKRSVALNEQVFSSVYRQLEPRMTEIEIALKIEAAMRSAGAERPGFDTIVASGENGALPHARPGERCVGENRPITIDMGLVRLGYCSDMTRTFVLGTPDERYLKIHRLVRTAQQAGIAAVTPGKTMQEVDGAARDIIAAAGYGAHFGHSLGHGVGLAVHEAPRVSSRSRRKLKPGMVITIEPGVYIPGWGGVRLENMVVVRENGCEILNADTTGLDL